MTLSDTTVDRLAGATHADRQIQSGLERARLGVEALARLNFDARIDILKRAATLMQGRKDELLAGMVRETAMPIRHARDLFDMSIKKLEFGYGYAKFLHGATFPELVADRVAFTFSELTLPQFHRHLRFRDNFPIGGLYESQAKAQG